MATRNTVKARCETLLISLLQLACRSFPHVHSHSGGPELPSVDRVGRSSLMGGAHGVAPDRSLVERNWAPTKRRPKSQEPRQSELLPSARPLAVIGVGGGLWAGVTPYNNRNERHPARSSVGRPSLLAPCHTRITPSRPQWWFRSRCAAAERWRRRLTAPRGPRAG